LTLVLTDRCDLERLEAVATQRQWNRVSVTRRDHVVMANVTWSSSPCDVAYFEDHCAEVRYLRLEGAGAEALYRELAAELPHHSLREVLEAAANPDPGESIRVLGRLSVLAPPTPDDRFTSVWEAKLQHPDSAVRRAAIRCAYAIPWPSTLALARARLDRQDRLEAQLRDLVAYLAREDQTTATPRG